MSPFFFFNSTLHVKIPLLLMLLMPVKFIYNRQRDKISHLFHFLPCVSFHSASLSHSRPHMRAIVIIYILLSTSRSDAFGNLFRIGLEIKNSSCSIDSLLNNNLVACFLLPLWGSALLFFITHTFHDHFCIGLIFF
jgi:hypothetical protein